MANVPDYTLQEETETCDTSQGFQSPPRFPSGLLPRNEQPRRIVFCFELTNLQGINEPMIKNNGFPVEVAKQGKIDFVVFLYQCMFFTSWIKMLLSK